MRDRPSPNRKLTQDRTHSAEGSIHLTWMLFSKVIVPCYLEGRLRRQSRRGIFAKSKLHHLAFPLQYVYLKKKGCNILNILIVSTHVPRDSTATHSRPHTPPKTLTHCRSTWLMEVRVPCAGGLPSGCPFMCTAQPTCLLYRVGVLCAPTPAPSTYSCGSRERIL